MLPAYTRKEVSRISTISKYQLRTLKEQGVDFPVERVTQNQTCYGPEQFFAILLVRELKVRGFCPEAVRRVTNHVQSRPGLPWERGLRWLLTDGYRVHFIADPGVVLALLEQRRNPAFVVIPLLAMEERMKLARPVVLPPRKEPQIAKAPAQSLTDWCAARKERWA